MLMLKHFLCLCLLVTSFRYCKSVGNTLEETSDAELRKLIGQEHYVVVLFTHDDQDVKCQEYERELAAIREDLVDSINAWVVKSVNSPLRQLFSPDPEPTIVFFRNQIPVLYDGPPNDEEMLETLLAYKETCVKDLTDTSFEHMTQAATGATTGDWLVMFYKDECEECAGLRARLETLGCKHKVRGINVAMVNKGSTGAVTGRRFEVAGVPALIFFRLGRMYRYELNKFDLETLSSFITGWYKNVKGDGIPLPKTPFDDLVQMCVDYIRDYPLLFCLMIGLPILLLIAFVYLTASSPEKPRSKKKKKAKEGGKEN